MPWDKSKGKHPGGRPVKYNNCMDFEAMAELYFEECDEKGKPYTMAGLALGLELSRQGVVEYASKPEFSDAHARIKSRVEECWEGLLFSKTGARGAQFALTNHYGWRDKKELDVDMKRSELSDDELKKKAAELLLKAGS